MPKKSVPKKLSKFHNLKSRVLFLCTCCSLVLLLFLTSFNINSFLTDNKVLGAETERSKQTELAKEKAFWEDFLAKNPTYLPGWIELSKIELSLGDFGYAEGAYNTARAINPNSQSVKELSQLFPQP